MTGPTQSDAGAFVVYSGFIKKGARMQSTAIVSVPARRRLCVVSDRRGRMSSRRGVRPELFQGATSPAYKAITRQIDDYAERTEALFDRMEKRLDRMDSDVQRTQAGQDRLTNELAEMRRDVGELRDATHMAANKAVVAAQAAAPVATAAASNQTIHAMPKTWWGRGLLIATAFTTLMVSINNLPDAARGIERFWAFIKGGDAPVHAEAKAEKK